MKPIYMDNAASTKISPEVLAKFNEVAENLYGNPSSMHTEGILAKACIDETKKYISSKINCSDDELYFTSGATMSNNILIQGVLRRHPETMFVTSTVEHNDIMELYDWLPYSKYMVEVNRDGQINMNSLWNILIDCERSNKPCLVSIQMANSETGIIQPIKQISSLVHEYGGYLHVDATQYIPYFNINVKDMGIDALSMSGQKIGGIKGSGLLYVCASLLKNMTSIIFGEQGLIGGTPSTPLIASLGEAFKNMDCDVSELHDKTSTLLSSLQDMGGKLVGTEVNRLPNNIYIRFPSIKGLTLMSLLSERGIYIGTGSACSTDSDKPSHVALAYGLSEDEALECIRFTLCNDNTYEEIEYVVKVLNSTLSLLR